jgi:C-terminal processing protease CtpA/Prc
MLLSLAVLTLAISQAEPSNMQFDPEEVREDLALARDALERLHPGYDRYTERAELDAHWAAMAQAAEDGADLAELYLGLSALLADIRCDHTKAELPDLVEQSWETEPVYLPFRMRLFEERMYVEHVAEGSALTRGDEVLRIDGDPVSERLQAARRYMPVDGYTDHVRDAQLEKSGEFLGSGFDHFDALLAPDDTEVILEVRRPGEHQTRSVTLSRIGYADFRALSGESRWRNFSDPDAVSVTRPADGVAVLSVETFVNYRTPISPDSVFQPIFAELNADGVETLIIDVRRNGGGSTEVMQSLLSYLSSDTPIQHTSEIWVTTIDFEGLRDHIQTWDPNALSPNPDWYPERPDGRRDVSARANNQTVPFARAADAFEGEIIILTSQRNASGVTLMYGVLAEQAHVTLVGERTGGSQEGPTAGIIWFLNLPNSGIVVRVPWLYQRSAMQDPEFGQGFTPDVLAPETYDSWLEGRDPAFEAALELARPRR